MDQENARTCEVCGKPFGSRRSDKKTCSAKCRKAKSRRTIDPGIGSPERKEARAWGLYESGKSGQKKAIIRDVARRELLPSILKATGKDREQDPSHYYAAKFRAAQKSKEAGQKGHVRGYETRTSNWYQGPGGWEDHGESFPASQRNELPLGRRKVEEAAVTLLWLSQDRRRRPIVHALAGDAIFLAALSSTMRVAYKQRHQKRRPWLKAVIELVREVKVVVHLFHVERERIRMLDQEIQGETEKLAATADRLDETLRISQEQWMEMRARTVTLSRLVLERYPHQSGLREAAERVIALDGASVTQQ